LGRVRAVPRLCELYPGICLTTEEKTRKNISLGKKIFSHGSRRVPVGILNLELSINAHCHLWIYIFARTKSYGNKHQLAS